MSESPVLGAVIRHRQDERDELQRLVDEFHARGGKTQYLSPTEGRWVTHDFTRIEERRKPR